MAWFGSSLAGGPGFLAPLAGACLCQRKGFHGTNGGTLPTNLSHTQQSNKPIMYSSAANGRRMGRRLPSEEAAGRERPVDTRNRDWPSLF